MVDDQPTGGPNPDDALRSADGIPAADEAWVRGLLADLDFLRPEPDDEATAEPASDPMPPWVWAQVSATLAAETGTARRRPAWMRWGGGLVAASVAVLAIGAAVTVFSGSTGPTGGDGTAVVAGTQPEAAMMNAQPEAAMMKEAAPAMAAASDLRAAPTLSFAGMVPPALRLMGSQTDYTAEELQDQVVGMLEQLEMAPAQARAALEQAPAELAVPDPEPPLMMQSPAMLRECITRLTQVATSTALLIDWATFHGEEAGVIVVPEYPASGASVPDVTELDVWVVDHECDVQDDDHVTMR